LHWRAELIIRQAADIPGAVYQLSFAPERNFDTVFPVRDELQAYMRRVASKFDIFPHLRCNFDWVESVWIEERNCWRSKFCHIKSGETKIHDSRVLISATGHLVSPKTFEAPGIASFTGSIVHSARWPENVDLAGKDVVVLGNGSQYDKMNEFSGALTFMRYCCSTRAGYPG
jgi:cation diffusion facilitator CzcD-associated flavoprotein CzcO